LVVGLGGGGGEERIRVVGSFLTGVRRMEDDDMVE
jgi:hypothetical protein